MDIYSILACGPLSQYFWQELEFGKPAALLPERLTQFGTVSENLYLSTKSDALGRKHIGKTYIVFASVRLWCLWDE